MIGFIVFSICFIVGFILYNMCKNRIVEFDAIEVSENEKEIIKNNEFMKTTIAEQISIPKSVIDNMKAAENEEANKAKKNLNDIPKKRKAKYKRDNSIISATEYVDENLVDDFVNSNVADVLYTPSVYLASEILENFNSKNDVIEEPVYNHYEEDRNRQAERASVAEDNSYSYSGYGSGGGGGSSSSWSDSGSSYDSGGGGGSDD